MRIVICALMAALAFVAGRGQDDATKKLPADVGPGRVAWFDLTTTDIDKSKEFHGRLFDWKFTALKETDLAVEIVSRGEAIGTIRVAEGEIGAFNGVVYIQVEDIRASCKKAQELGGKIPPGFPFDLPGGIGAIALVSDPSGHPIGMYSRKGLVAPKAK